MSIRSFESSASSRDSSEDCLENYDVVKQLEGGVTPQVHLATCKRGRLKRRTVVLKKVSTTESILDSIVVHQALCHPTILSLFSTFPIVDSHAEEDEQEGQSGAPARVMTRYLVLEYCGSHGTLSEHLPLLNVPLEESKIRGVVKALSDALVYLEKENVVHGRLIPESVYVTEDFRVKLGGFDNAIRIPFEDRDGSGGTLPTPETGVENPKYYLAPEIRAGLRYNCSSDLWSLGILILWMLDPSRGLSSEPKSTQACGELGTLVSQLLEKTPEKRIKARNISCHSFLDPRFPIHNLDPDSRPREQRDEAMRSASRKTREFRLNRGNQGVAISQKPFGELTHSRPPRDVEGGGGRMGYGGRFPDVCVAAGPSKPGALFLRSVQTGRRVASDPVYGTKERKRFLDPIEETETENEPACEERLAPGPRVRFRSQSVTAALPQFLQARSHAPAAGGGNSNDQAEGPSPESSMSILEVPAGTGVDKGADDGMNTEELLWDFEEAFHSPPPPPTVKKQAASNEAAHRVRGVVDTLVPVSHSTPAAAKPNAFSKHVSSPIHPPSKPPSHPFDDLTLKGTDTPRPTPFDTSFLPPQTHKVARGQLVVLPSGTLLVDFREGERRQGRKGVEVLTISPDGEEISVFSAPHMSSPCCLVEPSATYKLCGLPKAYWKLYATAGKLIEQIKQHIPRLVWYESDSKFTLMANFPDADLEAVFYSPEDDPGLRESGGQPLDKLNGSFPLRTVTMRIKITRNRQLVEISRQVFAPARVHDHAMKPNPKNPPLREKEGEWKKVVLVAPGGNVDAVDKTSLDEYESRGIEKTGVFLAVCRTMGSSLVEARGNLHDNSEIPRSSGPSSSVLACKTLPVDQHSNGISREPESIGLARKLGHSLTPTGSVPSMGWNRDCNGFPFEPPSLSQQAGNFETRFIPSVGWCVRHTGPSGGAGRYRMMFFDGKTLEVDVDEECVELMDSVRDEIVRYKIKDCGSKREIMEKMRAFKEFVSMFDDDGSSAE